VDNTWWDININGKILISVNGKSSAEFFYNSLRHGATDHYELLYSEKNECKNKTEEPVPISPWDLLDS
jgi:hypothetical protein